MTPGQRRRARLDPLAQPRPRARSSAIERGRQALATRAVAGHQIRQEVDRGGGAGQELVGQACRARTASGTASLAGSSLSGWSGSRTSGRAASTPQWGPEELVGRAGVEVRAERVDVDQHVGRVVDAVDVQQCPGGVGQLGDRPRTSGTGADQVGGRGHRDQPGPIGEDRGDLLGSSSPVSGSKSAQRTVAPARSAAIDPRAHVGVVVEPGDDDLVARAPAPRQGAGEVHRQLGHRPAEHDAPRVGVQQVGHRRPAGGRPPARRCARPQSPRRRWRAGRPARRRPPRDDVGGLGPAGAVEVRGPEPLPVAELGEVRPHAGNVVRRVGHALILLPRTNRPDRHPGDRPSGPARATVDP